MMINSYSLGQSKTRINFVLAVNGNVFYSRVYNMSFEVKMKSGDYKKIAYYAGSAEVRLLPDSVDLENIEYVVFKFEYQEWNKKHTRLTKICEVSDIWPKSFLTASYIAVQVELKRDCEHYIDYQVDDTFVVQPR